MSQFRNYLNIMSSAAASGNINVTLQTTDTAPLILQTLVATGITAGMSEVAIAALIVPQLTTQLIQYGILYTGTPLFSTYVTSDFQIAPPPATFRITYTDHVLCFFCQSAFTLTVVDGPGCNATVTDKPLLATIAQMQAMAPLEGVNLATYTTAQIILLIQLASGRLISALNNRFVRCTYLYEGVGNWQRSLFLRQGLPGVSFDGVRVRRPNAMGAFGSPFGNLIGTTSIIPWNYVHRTGELSYTPSQNLFYDYDPSTAGNEIRVTYIAGEQHIPSAILGPLLTLVRAAQQGLIGGNIKSLKAGTWEVAFGNQSLIELIREELSDYIIFDISS